MVTINMRGFPIRRTTLHARFIHTTTMAPTSTTATTTWRSKKVRRWMRGAEGDIGADNEADERKRENEKEKERVAG